MLAGWEESVIERDRKEEIGQEENMRNEVMSMISTKTGPPVSLNM